LVFSPFLSPFPCGPPFSCLGCPFRRWDFPCGDSSWVFLPKGLPFFRKLGTFSFFLGAVSLPRLPLDQGLSPPLLSFFFPPEQFFPSMFLTAGLHSLRSPVLFPPKTCSRAFPVLLPFPQARAASLFVIFFPPGWTTFMGLGCPASLSPFPFLFRSFQVAVTSLLPIFVTHMWPPSSTPAKTGFPFSLGPGPSFTEEMQFLLSSPFPSKGCCG